jgi:hypothetical protein
MGRRHLYLIRKLQRKALLAGGAQINDPSVASCGSMNSRGMDASISEAQQIASLAKFAKCCPHCCPRCSVNFIFD